MYTTMALIPFVRVGAGALLFFPVTGVSNNLEIFWPF